LGLVGIFLVSIDDVASSETVQVAVGSSVLGVSVTI
jgi:hypothetical protein